MPENERNRHFLIEEMINRYLDRAWSDSELAKDLNTDRTNIYKIRTKEFEKMGIFVEPVEGKRGYYRLDKESFVGTIRLTPSEMLTLYLGGRRLQQQTKTSQKDVANALKKLSNALQKPLSHNLVESAEHILAQEQDEQQAHILHTLISCWINGRSVHIEHQKLHGEPRKYLVSPYQLEPSIWGDGIYLIGYSDYHQRIASFKLSRIRHASQTTQPYKTPDDFDSHTMLHHAWGIWTADNKDPITVRLQFNKYVTPRVKESIWHPEQTIQPLPDGGCIWQAEIAEPREMLPWIRGWGSDVEVLKPDDFRDELKKTAVRLNKLYKTISTSKLLHHIPYAKTNRKKSDEIHLLLYHLIDVGLVAHAIWQDVLTDSSRQRLAHMLDLTVDECGRFIAFIASLHDLGKAGPAYQKKYAPDWLKKELADAGLFLHDPNGNKAYDKSFPHGTVSTWTLTTLLPEMIGMDKPFARKIAIAIGGHHGTWPQPSADRHLNDSQHPQWDIVRRDLVWELMGVFAPPKCVAIPKSITDQNSFLTILSGLVSVSDWVGSRNDECFDYIDQPMSSRQYAQRAAAKAQEGLQDLGWIGWRPTGDLPTFANAFAYLNFDAPRDVQKEVIDLARDVEPPALLILEAPTGIGKTETAVYIANSWLQQHKGRGLYVAMPTQATSNQMYGRIGDFLNHRYPDMNKNYHLVHGQAAWLDELQKEVELQSVGDDAKARLSAESWFKPRKRTLLAPFGVGTVDQTLMSILQTKHFFVRLFGLSHKVIIFDEVHAYDIYMNTLFHRLLAWLNAIGTSVIILSATLPAKTRHDLVAAYTGKSLPETKADYPALTIANDQRQETISLSKPKSYPLQLDWSVSREPEAIAAFLQEELADGGCTAVICNTVQRAQDVYRAIQQANIVPADELILFHARFPPVWRKEIEAKVLAKFGKEGNRPHKAIVVATQVVEQSLDLDFDVMVTDLAPVDLILQRAGRLHRHKRDKKVRHGHPRRLIITQPHEEDNIPKFEMDKFVYGDYILLRSYLMLRSRAKIVIPEDTVRLIESVYGDLVLTGLPPVWQAALQSALADKENDDRETAARAGRQPVLPPDNRRLLSQKMTGLEEDNPEVHTAFRAKTRDIDVSMTLICLHKTAVSVAIYDKEDLTLFNLEDPLRSDLPKKLLQNSISIQHKGLINHFTSQQIPFSWQENATLRYCRYVIFEDGECDLPKHTLKLDEQFGLQIIRKEEVA
ncbi:MAG: CRISPR-associated helicase Cas3' [Chloroflexi bacterium]|nr:CRISPR-associated helicase Cas3' [Chloroflexota bacterium]